MVEGKSLNMSARDRGVSFESTFQRDIRWYAGREEHKAIPRSMRRIAKNAAIKALLMPREKLWEEIKKLDLQARENQDSVAGFDRRESGSLRRRRNITMEEIHRTVSSESQRSAFITKLDRKLIASRMVKVKLAERYKRMPYSDIVKDPKFKAAYNLCMDLVFDHFSMLPDSQQRDLQISHPQPHNFTDAQGEGY